MTKKVTATSPDGLKRLLLGVYAPYNTIEESEHYFEEFLNLVSTADLSYTDTFFTKIRSIDKANFLTKGKLAELEAFCQEKEIEEIVCSEALTPLQERNLEGILDCLVIDREYLILEIFKKSAHSGEGKIQVEMAEIEFFKTRMAGKGRDFAQQEGRIGARVPVETVKEKLRRFFADRLRNARKRLATLQKVRSIQRKRRLESKLPLVSLAGYTNTGKSSVLNILTRSEILAEDKLFATLDTTTRELYLGEKKKILLSDTVGFISNLPHHLIEAFKATLDELSYATLLLHVIDCSNPAWKNHITIVQQTLQELSIKAPTVYVFNKIDLLSSQDLEALKKEAINFQPHLFVHTKSKTGMSPLFQYLLNYSYTT